MAESSQGRFKLAPSDDHPGWMDFASADPLGFNSQVLGPILVRQENDRTVRVRIRAQRHLANALGNIHGGGVLGLADMSLFATLCVLTGRDPAAAVTVDLATQFIGGGEMARPVDAVVELLRETGRMAFLRGMIEQDDTSIAAFQGTVRKLGPAA